MTVDDVIHELEMEADVLRPLAHLTPLQAQDFLARLVFKLRRMSGTLEPEAAPEGPQPVWYTPPQSDEKHAKPALVRLPEVEPSPVELLPPPSEPKPEPEVSPLPLVAAPFNPALSSRPNKTQNLLASLLGPLLWKDRLVELEDGRIGPGPKAGQSNLAATKTPTIMSVVRTAGPMEKKILYTMVCKELGEDPSKTNLNRIAPIVWQLIAKGKLVEKHGRVGLPPSTPSTSQLDS